MTNNIDRHNLERFVRAQEDVHDRALAEIRAGRKQTHWMWFIFPQFDGLAFSAVSRQFAIRSVAEARAYLQHPVLGSRLVTCCKATVAVDAQSATAVFGHPDDLKLRSCATLFAAVSPPGSVFQQVLEKFFDGKPDSRTIRLLGASDDRPRN